MKANNPILTNHVANIAAKLEKHGLTKLSYTLAKATEILRKNVVAPSFCVRTLQDNEAEIIILLP
jgi:hypothetical protein